MDKPNKKDLEEKIRELEKKLLGLNDTLNKDKSWMRPDREIIKFDHQKRDKERRNLAVGSSPVGVDKIETIREVVRAKNSSEQKAGLIKTTGDGSVLEDDNEEPIIIPAVGIHDFDNTLECTCTCHPSKQDCIKCYDHPVHLEHPTFIFV